jgi:4-hydroxybenzoate polyprenyltransferase
VSVKRLKEVPVVSSALVAVAWSLPVVMLPVAFADAPLGPVAGVLFCYFALGTFVNTELANVSDVESDVAAGVTTLPTSLGVDGTRAVLFGVATLSALVVGAALAAGHLSMAAALALGLGLAALAAVLACLGRAGRDWLLSVAAECSRLPALAALVLFSG